MEALLTDIKLADGKKYLLLLRAEPWLLEKQQAALDRAIASMDTLLAELVKVRQE